MSIPFPAGGSLYYPQDLEKVARGDWNPVRGRAFLRRSRFKSASVVWQEITARRRQGTYGAKTAYRNYLNCIGDGEYVHARILKTESAALRVMIRDVKVWGLRCRVGELESWRKTGSDLFRKQVERIYLRSNIRPNRERGYIAFPEPRMTYCGQFVSLELTRVVPKCAHV